MLDKTVLLLSAMIVISKVAFKAGSSQHGKARRASGALIKKMRVIRGLNVYAKMSILKIVLQTESWPNIFLRQTDECICFGRNPWAYHLEYQRRQ